MAWKTGGVVVIGPAISVFILVLTICPAIYVFVILDEFPGFGTLASTVAALAAQNAVGAQSGTPKGDAASVLAWSAPLSSISLPLAWSFCLAATC